MIYENLLFFFILVILAAYPLYVWITFLGEMKERDRHLSNANLAFYDTKGNLIAYNRSSNDQQIPPSHL